MLPHLVPRLRRARREGSARGAWLAAALALLVLAGCGFVSTSAPPPTAADFPGIAIELGSRGIRITAVASGDPGCDDPSLAPTAIRFMAQGLDQAQPTVVYLYIFRNRAAWERRRVDVDACVRAYVTDPENVEVIEASPFILAAQGPWAPEFGAAMRAGLAEAAGTGG